MADLGMLAALALVDSLNPSALAVTLYLLLRGGRAAAPVLAYLSGALLTYLASGILLVAGLDALLARVGDRLQGPVWHLSYGALGLVLVAVTFLPERRRGGTAAHDAAAHDVGVRAGSLRALFLLGAVVTVVEFSTALPYLAAVGVLSGMDAAVTTWLPILVAYNVVVVLPPLALLGGALLLGRRLEPCLGRLRTWLQEHSREAFLWVVGALGGLLVINSVTYFAS